MQKLINNGVDINCKNSRGDYPIHITCNYDSLNIEKTKILILAGANLEVSDKDGMKPIHLACNYFSSNKIELLKLLINNNVNFLSKDNRGLCPIHYLFRSRLHWEVTQIFRFLVDKDLIKDFNYGLDNDYNNYIVKTLCFVGNWYTIEYLRTKFNIKLDDEDIYALNKHWSKT